MLAIAGALCLSSYEKASTLKSNLYHALIRQKQSSIFIWNVGEMAPDDVTHSLIAKWFSSHKDADGFLIEGYPRTMSQLQDYMLMVIGFTCRFTCSNSIYTLLIHHVLLNYNNCIYSFRSAELIWLYIWNVKRKCVSLVYSLGESHLKESMIMRQLSRDELNSSTKTPCLLYTIL